MGSGDGGAAAWHYEQAGASLGVHNVRGQLRARGPGQLDRHALCWCDVGHPPAWRAPRRCRDAARVVDGRP